MTPGAFTTPFYQGVAWSFPFLFKDATTGDPLDLTGLGPFVMSIQGETARSVKYDIEGTGAYDSTGIVTFSLTAEQTSALAVGNVLVGVKNNADLPYMVGTVPVYKYPH